MSAESINIITIDFPDPDRTEIIDDRIDRLASNESFEFPVQNIQTLSSKGVERGDDPYGLLYIPALQTDECRDSEKDYVPENATRLANLPYNAGYALIAVAPWFSPNCMKEYFTTARNEPVKAFIVYQPDPDSTAMPPETNDQVWAMNDGGSWQYSNQFPTYAVPGASGYLITSQMSNYSGNISTVPYGDSLSKQYSETDYIRLWAKVTADSGTQLPSLWVFLVIVLGLLILIIGATSLCMHIVQRRRRNALRRRVINGEVDLEALGVKRLTVPADYLSKLPVFPYLGEPDHVEKSMAQASTPADAETGLKGIPLSRRSSAPDAPPITYASAIFAQSTCPICLDDFEPKESQVRELPCRHIFHVDCIDPFLLNNSSLCPICKQSVLPPGYCPPKITNIMVRRERLISRRRAQDASGHTHSPGNIVARLPGAYDSLRARVGRATGGRRIFSAPSRTQSRPADIEMSSGAPAVPLGGTIAPATPAAEIVAVPQPTQQNSVQECPEPPSDQPHQRREWARQRALALLGTQHGPVEGEEEELGRSRWRRGLNKIFPGFR
ncbi:uncharacterized protein CC84DRAFT_1128588 [Paraphaeosphaeria sporulosa]|uniref:RING-type domain-containing protein n=1 Tax=Paraphaeosphaeria sporulosa TaxID=1460663 RepID=A0A177C2T0_9PLEO|nr:uncharacterized protein CC84DRAFT_1128588 [Paraphaeosphaeria sporulosa]OAG01162.1 hypothetical protein CC84DRAFT_1128588 [Paraphaeosphaeria sporulosa]